MSQRTLYSLTTLNSEEQKSNAIKAHPDRFSSNASGIWVDEVEKNFPCLEGKAKHWFDSPDHAKGRSYSRLHKVLNTNAGSVIEHVHRLPDEPDTAKHIVLTTYQTMRVRGLMVAEEARKDKRDKRNRKEWKRAEDFGLDDEDDEEISRKNRMFYKSPLARVFGRAVCDKAHYMKNPASRARVFIFSHCAFGPVCPWGSL